MKTLALLFAFVLTISFVSCEKEAKTDVIQATGDSICVVKTIPGDVIIEIDDISTTWYVYQAVSMMAPDNGKPGYVPFLNKQYQAYMRESNKDWILIEEGLIRQVVVIDGISWN